MYNILVIDDDPDILDVICDLLEVKYECSIERALNGEEALQKTGSKKYDLICTDHRMPIVNGGKFVVFLRGREGHNQQTPILIITGHYDKVKQYQMALKHVYVHVKPIIPQELYAICDMALSGGIQDLLDR